MRLLIPLSGVALLLAAPALAHHGWGSYDDAKVLTLTAPIDAMSYENPHGELRLTAEGKPWRVVLAPPSRMQARGLPADMLKPGTTVRVEGYPSKVHADEMRAERITVDGKRVELR
ncbi:MAG: DUF6152 family protein [Magnetospirillum sp.]|nr:DUF6152 family protein [Magnetospirillum sp.]